MFLKIILAPAPGPQLILAPAPGPQLILASHSSGSAALEKWNNSILLKVLISVAKPQLFGWLRKSEVPAGADSGADQIMSTPAPAQSKKRRPRLHTLKFVILSSLKRSFLIQAFFGYRYLFTFIN